MSGVKRVPMMRETASDHEVLIVIVKEGCGRPIAARRWRQTSGHSSTAWFAGRPRLSLACLLSVCPSIGGGRQVQELARERRKGDAGRPVPT
jgi:hypothetical protein